MTDSEKKIQIFIVDDHQLIREGLKNLLNLESDIDIVGEAAEGRDAVEKIAEVKPDVVLMDINLKGEMNGFDVTKEILANAPEMSVIILTVYDADEYVIAAIKAGAAGFLQKEVDAEELVSSIRRAADGESLMDDEVRQRVMEDIVSAEERLSSLTKREREILGEIGKGLANKEIADKLFVSEGTVKNHITSLFRKLGVQGRTQAALMAWQDRSIK